MSLYRSLPVIDKRNRASIFAACVLKMCSGALAIFGVGHFCNLFFKTQSVTFPR